MNNWWCPVIILRNESYKDLTLKPICVQYEKEMGGVEQGTFTSLVFTTTWGMAEECKRYHSRRNYIIQERGGLEHHHDMDKIYSLFRLA